MTTCEDGLARLWDIPMVVLPPDWLPALAEGIAGIRFNKERVVELVSFDELQRARLGILPNDSSDECMRWARRFLRQPDSAKANVQP